MKETKLWRSILFDQKFWILRHLIFWFTLYLGEFLSLFGIVDMIENPIEFLKVLLLDMTLIYVNIYYILPKFLMKGKVGLYLLFTAIGLCIVAFINSADTIWDPEFEYESGDWFYIFYDTVLYTLSVLATAVAIKAAKIIYEKSKRETALVRQKTNAEINALKQQVNPHFLFNSLNNLYILAKTKDESLPDQLLKLSDLMRYQTYEAAKNKILLSKEIEFLSNYLELEKIRRDKLVYTIDAPSDVKNINIQPLLFLPFVENACKHSAKADGSPSEINISWRLKNDHTLQFKTSNNQGDLDANADIDSHGAGLENIKSRLHLLFGTNYSLDIDDGPDKYSVLLQIKTSAI